MSQSKTNEAAVLKVLEWQELEQKNPHRFAPLADKPQQFVSDVLGQKLWSKQVELLEAARTHRRIAVRSGHGTGKTFAVAALILWWLYARQGMVVTTAPTWEHVEGVLWREINGLGDKALVHLPGTAFHTERRITDQWYALGLSTNKPSAFQGRHHARLLVVLDEAPGVDEQVHLEVSTLATGEQNCIVMIGNPTTTSGTFYDAFKPQSEWHQLHISCLDHPNVVEGKEIIEGAVTRGWVDGRRKTWGPNHPFWYSRVLGEFPRISVRGVIPLGWAERAQNEEKRVEAAKLADRERIPRIGGLDVARYGDNACVLIVRRGDAVEAIETWHHTSLMETTGLAKRAYEKYELNTLVVDSAGLGAGVVDRLLEQNINVYAYNGGHRAFTPQSFANRRSELWWGIRQRLELQRLWLPLSCDILISDLITPEYEVISSGRLRVETKETLLNRGAKSTDFADALVMCFALDEDPEAELLAAKGRNQDQWPGIEQELSGMGELPNFPRGF